MKQINLRHLIYIKYFLDFIHYYFIYCNYKKFFKKKLLYLFLFPDHLIIIIMQEFNNYNNARMMREICTSSQERLQDTCRDSWDVTIISFYLSFFDILAIFIVQHFLTRVSLFPSLSFSRGGLNFKDQVIKERFL